MFNNCNKNFPGDSALHDAIGKENSEVVELLCNVPSLDLTIRNKRGFNCLHHASLKGNVVSSLFDFHLQIQFN
jgi:E3 ubiquitin-protein ligase mind-bomb